MKQGPEIEAKFRLKPGQREAIVSRLGAPARVLRQRDEYFDVPGRVLRVRTENGKPFLTRKDAAEMTEDGIKSRHEVEFPLPEDVVPRLEELLEWLGHRRLMTVEKERHEYDLDGFLLCLDRIAGLDPPDYVELESTGGDNDALRRWRDRLGLSADQAESRSYAALLAQRAPIEGKAPDA